MAKSAVQLLWRDVEKSRDLQLSWRLEMMIWSCWSTFCRRLPPLGSIGEQLEKIEDEELKSGVHRPALQG